MKTRLDVLLVERGLAESREKAQRLILAGAVRVRGQAADKPGRLYDATVEIELAAAPRFVSRGGEKLDAAFAAFDLDVGNLVCMDLGASTGGFTDCLLQRGARRVYAVDVGHGQLDWRLRNDPRVVVREGVNARHLTAADFDDPVRFASVDVSFISLTLILPVVTSVLVPGSTAVTLIKPQFEAGRKEVGKGGVVRDPAVREAVVTRLREFGTGPLGLEWRGICESPLRGPAGNVEFLACWRKPVAGARERGVTS